MIGVSKDGSVSDREDEHVQYDYTRAIDHHHRKKIGFRASGPVQLARFLLVPTTHYCSPRAGSRKGRPPISDISDAEKRAKAIAKGKKSFRVSLRFAG